MISKRPTMMDVATRVGVSRQLVGLAFRNEAGVSSSTRERIFEAASELGYSPDIAARSLRRRSSNYIGVLFNPAHSSADDIVEALYAAAHERGYNLILGALTATRDERDAITELLGFRTESVILISPETPVNELRKLAKRLPVVSIGRPLPQGVCSAVRSDGQRGIAAAVDHLVELGHRDIAYVLTRSLPEFAARHQGYVTAMDRHGLPLRVREIGGDFTEESGAGAAESFLAEPVMPTAVVCSNDHAAMGLINRLLRAGLRVPEDVSVTGYDDSRIARLSFVDLTSVRQDPAEMSTAAVEAAVQMMSDQDSTPQERMIVPTLVIRGSTGQPRSEAQLHPR
ncbi:LacI family transcriptional regulator [Pseudarthrobacter sp. MDT3-28]|uniref:LacI family DNA-binding transcriptional regulator n=1 Tax=Pseudarthrobacter raffinosi TaxID=2953651 RepID=UPI00208FB8DE|nr:LacI family DNA-binding transcriptional regulator [Pseudarthrobacter sp. MDT3-28]MCO4238169.1 LacI family transcriptional regulator [Pseudarthrobacter sp. MDT3-28]